MGSLSPAKFNVKRIAIIGAGPAGLVAAKYLKAQGDFTSIVLFEQRDEVGGIWHYSDVEPEACPVPQEDPFYRSDRPLPSKGSDGGSGSGRGGGAPIIPSPLYSKLHANIPGPLMEFTDLKFPSDAWLYPRREAIHQYLVRYAEDLRELIKFQFQVKSLSLHNDNGHDRWHLEAQSTVDDERIVDVFDAVVVANGHYSVPFLPAIKNIERFHASHPSVITHSKQYRKPGPFVDKKVIVVGNGPSGTDIALQINAVSRKPTLLSVREATPPERLAHTGCEEVPKIVEFLPETRGVRFSDGRVETDLDAVVFCTGFLFSYPFLQPDLQAELITSGRGVHGLYKHLFYIRRPTLVFPALNYKAVPWPQAEAQAALIVAVWANRLDLPDAEEMRKWSQSLEETQGEALHVFAPLEDGRYINEMHDWIMQAAGGGVSKEPPHWDEAMFWQRKIYAEAKLRFEQDGCKAKSLEDLGFRYEPPE